MWNSNNGADRPAGRPSSAWGGIVTRTSSREAFTLLLAPSKSRLAGGIRLTVARVGEQFFSLDSYLQVHACFSGSGGGGGVVRGSDFVHTTT